MYETSQFIRQKTCQFVREQANLNMGMAGMFDGRGQGNRTPRVSIRLFIHVSLED